MKVGGRRLLIIPGDLAYGCRQPARDRAENETLVFVVDVVSVPSAAPKETHVRQARDRLHRGASPTDLVVDGPRRGRRRRGGARRTVLVHYVGVDFETGEQFDASWDRGEPLRFPLRGLIQGWQDGIPGMRVGGRRQLVIPPAAGLRRDRWPSPGRDGPWSS